MHCYGGFGAICAQLNYSTSLDNCQVLGYNEVCRWASYRPACPENTIQAWRCDGSCRTVVVYSRCEFGVVRRLLWSRAREMPAETLAAPRVPDYAWFDQAPGHYKT